MDTRVTLHDGKQSTTIMFTEVHVISFSHAKIHYAHSRQCFLVHSVMNYTQKHHAFRALIISHVQINVLCDVITYRHFIDGCVSRFHTFLYTIICHPIWKRRNLEGWKEASWCSGQIFKQQAYVTDGKRLCYA